MPAVHRHAGAGHPRPGLGREQQEQAVQLFRFAQAAHRDALDERLAIGGVPHGIGHLGADVARLDGIDADAVARHSSARLLVMCTTAALDVAYSMAPGITRSPRMDAMLMMEPPRPASTQRCAARAATSHTPRTLVAISASKSAAGSVSDRPSLAAPALLTTTSSVTPKASSSAKAPSMDCSEATSISSTVTCGAP